MAERTLVNEEVSKTPRGGREWERFMWEQKDLPRLVLRGLEALCLLPKPTRASLGPPVTKKPARTPHQGVWLISSEEGGCLF